MVPIGEREKPLLEYVVKLLTYHGFGNIIMLTNYRSNQIVNYFNEGPRFNAKFEFIQDREDVKGTGGALLNASDKLDDNFVIYYGDILSALDMGKLWKEHTEADAAVTVALARDFPVRVGVAEMGTGGELKGFVEKPMLGRPVAIGIFCMNKRCIKVIEEIRDKKKVNGDPFSVDITGDLIPALIERGDKVRGFFTDSFWYDVGSLERYEKLENHVVEKELSFLLE
jgi:mannose-1-phosphate guanylyltransferase